MDDLISRQAAISIPLTPKEHRKYQTMNLDDAYDEGWGDYQACIAIMPSAERRGRWVDLKCDQCGQVDMSKPNYCPNCGAKMEDW